MNPFSGPQRPEKPKNPQKTVTFQFDEITMAQAKDWLDEEDMKYKTMPKTPNKPADGLIFVFEEQSDALLFKMHWQDQDKRYAKQVGGKTG